MKVEFLEEPELEFGTGRHIDIRFGISNYGPHDIGSDQAPSTIRVGIVGTAEDVDRARAFLELCRTEIAGAKSRQPNLRPPFPGFSKETAFRSTLVLNDELVRTVPTKRFEEMRKSPNSNEIVGNAVRLFLEEFEQLHRHKGPDVLICTVPEAIAELMDPTNRPRVPAGEPRVDFHDSLKAECLRLPPIQLMLASTSDPTKARKHRKTRIPRRIQDDATRAWNLHTALYYKALGRPWRLPREKADFATCYIGISFFHALDRSRVLTSVAQVFDERGDGLIVQGGPAEISKDDRSPHLSETDSNSLLEHALQEYRQTHGNFPARVVLHKSSTYSPAELSGFSSCLVMRGIDRFDAISVSSDSGLRAYRYGAYPPLRGTLIDLDSVNHILFTRGSVEFYQTYPGLYVPQPLLFRCESVQESTGRIARELLALSKLNWNRSQFDGSDPITVVAARSVGAILKHLPIDTRMAARYSHFM